MKIQLIERLPVGYRLLIDGNTCLFLPPDLFTAGITPVKRCLNNYSFGWYVNRTFVSYRQVKGIIQNQTGPDGQAIS